MLAFVSLIYNSRLNLRCSEGFNISVLSTELCIFNLSQLFLYWSDMFVLKFSIHASLFEPLVHFAEVHYVSVRISGQLI